SELVTTLPLEPQPDERWAILGPEAEAFSSRLHLAARPAGNLPASETREAELDGLLLAGALSAEAEAVAWLEQVVAPLRKGATLVVIEWQGDGPLDIGPDLERRFKRGKLCRLLREWGFSRIEFLADQPIYYIIRASNESPASPPHAGQFVPVANLAELPKNTMKQVELFGRQIIVANTGREIVAFDRACPHAGTSLDQGKLKGRQIICPQHYYMWNVCTGDPIEPADEDTLSLYPVKVDPDNGLIQVALAA
ncbi:MAG: Rieske 2Fe-2S domain-containing protein, partial [Chloroflexi bacterium]|nr:Rieske 2Fe-2S domain-containing protein [Chloroflexota bacterium]